MSICIARSNFSLTVPSGADEVSVMKGTRLEILEPGINPTVRTPAGAVGITAMATIETISGVDETVEEVRDLAREVLTTDSRQSAYDLAKLVRVLDEAGVLGPRADQPTPMQEWTIELGRVPALDADGVKADDCAITVLAQNTWEAEQMLSHLMTNGALSMHGNEAKRVPAGWTKLGWI